MNRDSFNRGRGRFSPALWPIVATLILTGILDCTAAAVLRGPYLQLQTTNSIVVRWRTDRPVEGVVFFGENSQRLDRRACGGVVTNEHEVRVDGLESPAKYFYTIGERADDRDTPSLTIESKRFFRAAPPIGSRRSIRIWVLGDSGTANRR
jgi:hypothetical protein